MSNFVQEINNWAGGAQLAVEPDRIPLEASPLLHNVAFRSIAQGQAILGTRPGLTMVNSTALSGSPAIGWMKPYYYDNAGAVTKYLALVTKSGKLYYKNADDTLTSELVPPANFPNASVCFTNGTSFVDGAVARNTLFLVNSSGERRCLVNQTFKAWGLEPIATIAVTNVATGSSSMPAETYGVWVTTYDSTTGQESSASAEYAVTTTANQRIQVTITPTSAETAQYPYWRVYLRRNTTQAIGYRVLVMENLAASNIVTDGNIPIATTTVYVDLSASDIANLVLPVPNQTENDFAASSTLKYVASYGQRIIVADNYNLYWSKIDNLGAFPPNNTDRVDDGDGGAIKGITPFSDDLLLIFTTNNVMGLYGNDPQTWVLKPIDQSIGSTGHLSVMKTSYGVAWWAPTVGPVVFDGQKVDYIGLNKLGQTFVAQQNEPDAFSHYCGAYDSEAQRFLWSYALDGSTTRNNAILPFRASVGEWESSIWDPMDVASMSMGPGAGGKDLLYIGNYAGQLFYFNESALNDGAPGGTKEFTFTATASSHSTIAGTSFYTTGAGLVERKITITDSNNAPIARGRIASNTSTLLTLGATITGLTSGATYNVYVGAPDVRIYTKWLDADAPFLRKRFDRVYLHARNLQDSTDLFITTQLNFTNEYGIAQTTFTLDGVSWDSAVWDSSVWGGAGHVKRRLPVFRTAHAMRVVILHPVPDKDISLLKISVMGRLLSDRDYS